MNTKSFLVFRRRNFATQQYSVYVLKVNLSASACLKIFQCRGAFKLTFMWVANDVAFFSNYQNLRLGRGTKNSHTLRNRSPYFECPGHHWVLYMHRKQRPLPSLRAWKFADGDGIHPKSLIIIIRRLYIYIRRITLFHVEFQGVPKYIKEGCDFFFTEAVPLRYLLKKVNNSVLLGSDYLPRSPLRSFWKVSRKLLLLTKLE